MKRKAFTLIEIMLTMVTVGMLFFLTAINVKRISTDSDMARFKKGYSSIESAVGFLVNNTAIYGSRLGFKDLSKANLVLGDEAGENTEELGEVIGEFPLRKFRDGFKFYLNVVKNDIDCNLYGSVAHDSCFMTDDGVVFGIPDTDFSKAGVIQIRVPEDDDFRNATVVPITMYVKYNGTEQDPKKDAFIIGVEYDGNLHFVKTYNDCNNHPKELQCKMDKFINSKTITYIDEGIK